MTRLLTLAVLALALACAPVQMVNRQADAPQPPQPSALQRECAPCVGGVFFIVVGVMLIWAVTQRS
jgi:hypothetical protein